MIDTYNPNHNNKIYTTDDNHGSRKNNDNNISSTESRTHLKTYKGT